MDEKMNQQDHVKAPHNSVQKRALIGAILLLALIGGGFWIYSSWRKGELPIPGAKIPRGGTYEELAKTNPQGAKFLEYITNAYARLDNDDPADDVSAYVDLGFYKNELGDYDGAIAAYKKGLELNPANELVLSNLAHLYENLKQYNDAETYYQKLVNANPKNVRGIIDLASLWRYYFKDKKDAILNLVEMKGLAANANDPNLMIFLANYYRYDLSDLSKAEIYYRRILELDPNNQAVKVELLNLLRQEGKSL